MSAVPTRNPVRLFRSGRIPPGEPFAGAALFCVRVWISWRRLRARITVSSAFPPGLLRHSLDDGGVLMQPGDWWDINIPPWDLDWPRLLGAIFLKAEWEEYFV